MTTETLLLTLISVYQAYARHTPGIRLVSIDWTTQNVLELLWYFEDCFASLAKQSQHLVNHWNKGIPSVAIPFRDLSNSFEFISDLFQIVKRFNKPLQFIPNYCKINSSLQFRFEIVSLSTKSFRIRVDSFQNCCKSSTCFSNRCKILSVSLQNHVEILSKPPKIIPNSCRLVSTLLQIFQLFLTVTKFYQCVCKFTLQFF